MLLFQPPLRTSPHTRSTQERVALNVYETNLVSMLLITLFHTQQLRQLVAGDRAPRRREKWRSWWHDPANDALEARLCGRLPSHSLFHISMCSPLNISTFLTGGVKSCSRGVMWCDGRNDAIFVKDRFLTVSPQFFDSNFSRNRKGSQKKRYHSTEALRYKPEGRGFDSQWCHWNFSFT